MLCIMVFSVIVHGNMYVCSTQILRIACNVNVYLIPTIHDSFCGNHKYKPNLLRRLSCAHLRALRCGSIYYLANHIPWTHHWTYCATAPPPGSTHKIYCATAPPPGPTHRIYCATAPPPGPTHWTYCTTAPPPGSPHWIYCATAPPPGSTHYSATESITSTKR